MAVSEKLAGLKSGKFGFGNPPKPDDAPKTMAKSEVIPEEGNIAVAPPENKPDTMPVADNAPAKTTTKRKAASKKAGNGTLRDGYVQMNCRVLEEVHIAIKIDCATHGKDKGEIITEAYQLWKKKHG